MIIYGLNTVEEVLKNWHMEVRGQSRAGNGAEKAVDNNRSRLNRIKRVYLDRKKQNDKKAAKIAKRVQKAGVDLGFESRDFIGKLVGHSRHGGVAADIGEFVYHSVADLLKGEGRGMLLMADCLQDQRNLGAIIRSAYVFGARGLIVGKDRSAGINATTFFCSQGTVSALPTVQGGNLARTVEILKQEGYWVYGLDLKGEQPVFQTEFADKTLLLLGGEDRGLRPLMKKKCDFTIRIPSAGTFNNLNASTAAAIAMYEVMKQISKNQN